MLKLYAKCIKPQQQSRRLISPVIRYLSDEAERRESATVKRVREELAKDKQALKWRKSYEETGDVNSKFKLISNEEHTSDYIIMMQKPINLNPKSWLEAWSKRQERQERHMQQFVPERHQILGPDLAAAHFVLYRGGAVKFLNNPKWMRANDNKEIDLPNKYNAAFKVEALKCDNMCLYYEGLENLRWLQDLKFLSFNNVKTFDDWCLDRVSGSECPNLEVLDISGTNSTVNGLSCLYRLNKLKLLIVTDPKESLEYELTCAMLQQALPNLKIVDGKTVHD